MMSENKKILYVLGREPVGGVGTFIKNVLENGQKISCDFIISESNVQSDFHKFVMNKGSRVFWAPELSVDNIFNYNRWAKDFYAKYHDNYNIVHVNTPVVSFINLFYAKKGGIPVRIYHAHNTAHTNKIKNLRNLIQVKLAIRYTTDLFAAGKDAGKYNFGAVPFKVIKNGIKTENFKFNLPARDNIRDMFDLQGKFVILQVGTVNEGKNQKFIVEALSRLKDKDFTMKKLCFLIVGTGPKISELKKLVYKKNLDNYVKFVGKVTNNISDFYSLADLLVMPSISEGFPLTAIEGQCNGIKMLLSSSIDRSAGIITSARYLPINNPTIWAKEIKKIIIGKEWSSANFFKQRQETYKLVQKKGFDVTDSVKDLLDLYDKSLRNKK